MTELFTGTYTQQGHQGSSTGNNAAHTFRCCILNIRRKQRLGLAESEGAEKVVRCNDQVDTWSRSRYTWFYWSGHVPGALITSRTCICPPLDASLTILLFKKLYQDLEFLSNGEPHPTPPTATDIAIETEKQTLGVDAISTLCSELKVALMPFLHSLSALQLSSER